MLSGEQLQEEGRLLGQTGDSLSCCGLWRGEFYYRQAQCPSVLEETDGVGADVVIMAGGHSDTVDQSVQMAARNGQLIQVTHFRHGCPEFDITTFLWKQLNLQGSYMYTREDYEIAIEAIASKKVDISPLISKILPIDRAPELFEMAQDRTNPCIKLMIAF